MTSEVKKDGFLKRDLKPALSVFGRTVLAALMAFFVFMSIEVVVAGVFTERIGYHVWEVDEQMQVVRDLGEFYHENIDDVYKKLQELGYPVEGLTSSTTAAGATTATGDAATTTATGGTTTTTAPAIRLRTQEIFSKVDPVVHTASYVVSQICMFLIFASMV